MADVPLQRARVDLTRCILEHGIGRRRDHIPHPIARCAQRDASDGMGGVDGGRRPSLLT
jgi:hypothetical protein